MKRGGPSAARALALAVCGAACSLPFDEIGFGSGGAGGGGAGQASSSTSVSPSASTSTSSTDASSSVTGFGGADCASGGTGQCVPEAPMGWQGPVFMPADDVASCSQPALFGGLASDPSEPDSAVTATPLVCACACVGQPDQCDDMYVDPICTAGFDPFAVPVGMCAPAQIIGGNGSDVELSAPDIGQCAASATVDTAGTTSFVTPRDVCDVAVSETGCDAGQVCVPPDEPIVCVFQPGEHDCSTATGYPVKKLLAGGTTDTRGCTTGTCGCGGSPNGCVGSIEIFDGANCTGVSDTLATVGGCSTFDPPFAVVSARYTLANPNFTCGSSGTPGQTGAYGALDSQLFTLCCLK